MTPTYTPLCTPWICTHCVSLYTEPQFRKLQVIGTTVICSQCGHPVQPNPEAPAHADWQCGNPQERHYVSDAVAKTLPKRPVDGLPECPEPGCRYCMTPFSHDIRIRVMINRLGKS